MAKKSNFFNRRGVNIDLTHRCPLECPRCMRQLAFRNHGKTVPGEDISAEDFKKVADFFKYIDFEGQYSDPIHHPKFLDFLEICYKNRIETEIHTASSAKPEKWYRKAFETNPDANWMFSIDGLPNESSKYRINQDGSKLYKIMQESKNYLRLKPTWQYIVFNYNEQSIDQAIDMAAESDINFYLLQSARWLGQNDPYMPSKKYRMTPK